jgi:hypothetical protein
MIHRDNYRVQGSSLPCHFKNKILFDLLSRMITDGQGRLLYSLIGSIHLVIEAIRHRLWGVRVLLRGLRVMISRNPSSFEYASKKAEGKGNRQWGYGKRSGKG